MGVGGDRTWLLPAVRDSKLNASGLYTEALSACTIPRSFNPHDDNEESDAAVVSRFGKDGLMRDAPAPILIVTGPSGVGKTTVSRLVAAAFGEKSAHVRIDDFTRFVVNGWVEPWLPESSHQNEVLGGAVVTTAITFAKGGYSVVVDGHVFPDSLEELVPRQATFARLISDASAWSWALRLRHAM